MSFGVLTINGRDVLVTALEDVFMEGEFCDACNSTNEWLAARVVKVDATKSRVLVEFVQCPKTGSAQTWYPFNSDQLAVYASKSRQEYVAPLFHTYTAKKPFKDSNDLDLTRHTVQNNKYAEIVKSRKLRREVIASLKSDLNKELTDLAGDGTKNVDLATSTALVALASKHQSSIEKLEAAQEVEYLEIKSTESYRLRSGVSQLLPWFAQPVVWHHYPSPDHILCTHTRYSVTDSLALNSTDEAVAMSCHRWMTEIDYIGPTLRANRAGTSLGGSSALVNAPFVEVEELE
jgi:hypothetical protein